LVIRHAAQRCAPPAAAAAFSTDATVPGVGDQPQSNKQPPAPPPPPPPPVGLCCESGCVDCVWVQYAAALLGHQAAAVTAGTSASSVSSSSRLPPDLAAQLKAGVMARVAKEVTDPAIRSFIEMEISTILKRRLD
ncbi:hypothetical protein BOX15_Mlig031694g1, partial [Macrostomum lignano]